MRTNRPFLVGAALFVVAAYYAWWIFWSGDNLYLHSANAGNREALVRIHSALQIGADRDRVLEQYWSHRTEDLRLDVDAPGRWIVTMPGEFGASHWTLLVEFRSGKVSAVRVRTADGPRPAEGPSDKGAPDA